MRTFGKAELGTVCEW